MAAILAPDKAKIQEALLYLMNRAPKQTQYDLVKALFLADRAHMNRHGRPVTFDNYVAMEHGPVPSLAYDALKPKFGYLKRFGEERPWVYQSKKDAEQVHLFTAKRRPNMDYLSRTDIEALDRAQDIVSSLTFDQLRRLTHEDPAYIEAWNRRGNSLSSKMRLDLLIENDGESLAEDLAYVSANA
jgi:uncharacterized phage-associated protein